MIRAHYRGKTRIDYAIFIVAFSVAEDSIVSGRVLIVDFRVKDTLFANLREDRVVEVVASVLRPIAVETLEVRDISTRVDERDNYTMFYKGLCEARGARANAEASKITRKTINRCRVSSRVASSTVSDRSDIDRITRSAEIFGTLETGIRVVIDSPMGSQSFNIAGSRSCVAFQKPLSLEGETKVVNSLIVTGKQ